MTQCIIYCRVSTNYQINDGISLELQEKKTTQLAHFNEWNIKGVYTDRGISGKLMNNRPELQKALNILQSKDVFMVYSLSRLSRSVFDTLKLMKKLSKKQVELVSITEQINTCSPGGKVVFTIMLALNEFESDLTSARVKDAMREKKERGEFVGRPSYGYKLENGKGSNLIKVPEEQKVIERIKEMRYGSIAHKSISYKKIAEVFNTEKIPCRQAKIWYPNTIKRIIEQKSVITKGRDQRTQAKSENYEKRGKEKNLPPKENNLRGRSKSF